MLNKQSQTNKPKLSQPEVEDPSELLHTQCEQGETTTKSNKSDNMSKKKIAKIRMKIGKNTQENQGKIENKNI